MLWGAWANALATGLAAAFYGMASVSAMRRPRSHTTGRSAVPALFATIMYFLALAALRQAAAALSPEHPYFVHVDYALFLVLLVPAAAGIVPLVYLIASIRSDSRQVPRLAALVVAIPVVVGLFFAYKDGVSGPITSSYGTDWTLNSIVTRILLLVAILLPATAGSAWLIRLARELEAPASSRLRLVGWSCLVYFAVFTLDALALNGLSLLLARLVTAGAGFVAWRAYAERAAPPPQPQVP